MGGGRGGEREWQTFTLNLYVGNTLMIPPQVWCALLELLLLLLLLYTFKSEFA
jgi:hypothetical protein